MPNLELIINNDNWTVQLLIGEQKYYMVDPANKKLYISNMNIDQVKYDVWMNYHEPYRENYIG